MLLLVLQLLFFMFILLVDGEPFRFVFLRRLHLFSDLDFIQICTIDIFLGGLVIYLIAIPPLGLFNFYVTLAFTLFCFCSSIYLHFKTLRGATRVDELKKVLTGNKVKLLSYSIAFGMFLILLILQLSALSNFVLGGVFDESIHSLKVQVILEHNYIPLTLQPYLPEGVVYPQASHVIFAFAYYMLNFTVPKAVFYVTILFKSLSVFGAYFLGRKLSSNRIYPLALGFVFAFVSSWPLYVSWGSNPFLVGFPLFLVDLGLFFPLVHNDSKNSLAEIIAVGLLFGFAGALIVSYIQTLAVVVIVGFIYWLIKRREFVRRKLLEFIGIFSFSLVPLISVFYRFLLFFQYPGHNIGLPADFTGYQTTRLSFTLTQALQWAFDNLSPFYLIRILILFFIACLFILLWRTRNFEDVKSTVAFALAVFASATVLSFVTFFLPSDIEVIAWGHQGIILAVSMCILLVAFYDKVYQVCRNLNLSFLSRFFSRKVYPNILLAIVLLASLNFQFLYYRFYVDPPVLAGGYRMFAVTTMDDYNLMMWMRENLSSNGMVLVSPYESGLFIPAISHHKIAFPYSGSAFTHSYQTLVNLTCSNLLNQTAYDLMNNLSISHVFVGSDAAYWWFERHKWDPMLFLGNPNFKLVKGFGDAYLFQFSYTQPDLVFFDDFQHEHWDDYGWQAFPYGNGLTNVTVVNRYSHSSLRQLRITSQASYTVTEFKCAEYIARKFFVNNDSDVTLSFYLNATEGFHEEDTFAAIVSNIGRNQSIVITTPNGVFQGYSHSATLDSSEGTFNFDVSSLWQKAYGSSLPSSIILEFANYDFDGVKNVAYVDDVTIKSTPLAGLANR